MRHSAKNTRQKFDRQSPLCRVSFIGHFAECPGDTRQRKATVTALVPLTVTCRVPTLQALGKDFFNFFKKILCRVPTREALGKDFLFFLKNFFAECQPYRHSAKCFYFFKKNSLPSASHRALGKRFSFFFKKKFFAECQPGRHSAKIFYFFFNFFAKF